MAGMPPATSETIARQANLNERYVREWLGAMTSGRIVNYDPVARTYTLPAEHAALVTRGAVPPCRTSTVEAGVPPALVAPRLRHAGRSCFR